MTGSSSQPAAFPELFRPLRTHHFLSFVLRRLGLSGGGPQRELFRSPSEIARLGEDDPLVGRRGA